LGQWGEQLKHHFVAYHEVLLPRLYTMLADPVPVVQARSCYVLEELLENMLQHEIALYVDGLMTALGVLLQHPNPLLRVNVMSAVGE
jgi:hypothetical protein